MPFQVGNTHGARPVPGSVAPTLPGEIRNREVAEVVVLLVAGTNEGVAQPGTWINAVQSSGYRLALQIHSPFKALPPQLLPFRFPQPSNHHRDTITWGSWQYVRVVMGMFRRAMSLFPHATHFLVANGTSVLLVDGPGLLRAMTTTAFFAKTHVGIVGHLRSQGHKRVVNEGEREIIFGRQSGLHFTRRDLDRVVREWGSNVAVYERLNQLYVDDVRRASRSPAAACPKRVIPDEYVLQTMHVHVARLDGQEEKHFSDEYCSYEVTEPALCPHCEGRHAYRGKVLVHDAASCRQLFGKRQRAAAHHMFMRKVCDESVVNLSEDPYYLAYIQLPCDLV
jgi:hypothetical protein